MYYNPWFLMAWLLVYFQNSFKFSSIDYVLHSRFVYFFVFYLCVLSLSFPTGVAINGKLFSLTITKSLVHLMKTLRATRQVCQLEFRWYTCVRLDWRFQRDSFHVSRTDLCLWYLNVIIICVYYRFSRTIFILSLSLALPFNLLYRLCHKRFTQNHST